MFSSVQSMFAYILAQVESKEGRGKEWSGYTQYRGEEHLGIQIQPTSFDMENEHTGERISIAIEDDSWPGAEQKSYAILVTKKFIIRQDEKPNPHRDELISWQPVREWPTDQNLLDTLITYACKLHGDIGLHTLHDNKEGKELEKLRAEVARLKQRNEDLRTENANLERDLDDAGW